MHDNSPMTVSMPMELATCYRRLECKIALKSCFIHRFISRIHGQHIVKGIVGHRYSKHRTVLKITDRIWLIINYPNWNKWGDTEVVPTSDVNFISNTNYFVLRWIGNHKIYKQNTLCMNYNKTCFFFYLVAQSHAVQSTATSQQTGSGTPSSVKYKSSMEKLPTVVPMVSIYAFWCNTCTYYANAGERFCITQISSCC